MFEFPWGERYHSRHENVYCDLLARSQSFTFIVWLALGTNSPAAARLKKPLSICQCDACDAYGRSLEPRDRMAWIWGARR